MPFALSEGIMTTIVGMIVVFMVLMILIGLLELIGRVFAATPTPAEAVADIAPLTEPPLAYTPQAEVHNSGDDPLLVAVISAAIAAYNGSSSSLLRITSIKRRAAVESGWAAEARRQAIESRRM
ncbi:MAG: OadG family protein [Symbiobacteriaceae bacterium]|nr:OadG family protein [Symbiobacteriaceae bacterium]